MTRGKPFASKSAHVSIDFQNAPMIARPSPSTDVYSAREIARAAGVRVRDAQRVLAAGAVPTIDGGSFVSFSDALAAVRRLRPAGGISTDARHELFERPVSTSRRAGLPVAGSLALHAAMLAAIVVITTAGLRSAPSHSDVAIDESKKMRMIFLAVPGPGGGGGGGGLLQKAPPPKAQRKGHSALSSPLPRREPPKRLEVVTEPREVPKPAVVEPEPLPAIVAPIATAPADVQNRAGVLDEVRSETESRGSGRGGGVGTGTGTGIGEGEGRGVGPGSGGGTGGGPYRPGSGIQPPRLLQEVKPDYTEDARRKNIEGDVELEIVVRSNGTVGDVRLLRGLGAGLDQRAITAVKQWRFAPATRLNQPVDVIVEVAVEFRLR
jgi:TonB family protein